MALATYAKNIRLNPDGDNLNCTLTGSAFLECKVHVSHFINKTSGYYFT